MRKLVFLISLLGATLTTTAAAAELRFAETKLSVSGRITATHPMDVDGDGKIDLVILAGRQLLVYPGLGGGRMAREATLRATMPPGAVLYDLGDVDGDGALELATIDAAGVAMHDITLGATPALTAWKHRPILRQTVFRGGDAPKPRQVPFLVDLRGEGVLDCIVPEAERMWVFVGDGKGNFLSQHRVELERDEGRVDVQRSWNRSSGQDPSAKFVAGVQLPRLIAGQAGGPPGQRDLFQLQGQRLSVYIRDASGKLPATPSREPFLIPDPPRESGKKRRRILRLPVMIGDVDSNGLSDLVVADSAGGTVALHLQTEAGWPLKPSDLVKVPGWLVGAQLDDLNGDGSDDLILVRVDEIDIWGALQIMTSQKLPVEISVYLEDSGTFASRPSFVEAADIPIRIGGSSLDSIEIEAAFLPTATGDYDGDGVTDMVLLGTRGTLRIVGSASGSQGGSWQQLGTLRVAGLEGFKTSEVTAADLDGDGADDLIFLGRDWEDGTDDDLRVYLRR